MNTSIEKPKISDNALSQLHYLFWSKLWHLEEQPSTVTTFSQQAKIKRLRGLVKKFIYSRAYSFFKIVTLPPNGTDIENADTILQVKNFDYFIDGLSPKTYVIVIGITWDDFSVFEETVDKNLFKLEL